MPDDLRPRFARDFPRNAALDALVEAFARGDYARVRGEAPELERTADEPEVKRAARVLVDRTRPDPLAVALLLVTAALLVVLSGWWLVHGKPPTEAAPPAAPPVERVR
jgi:hypothetical protein